MWRFIPGVDNPKQKQTPEDKKQKDKEYEAKRRKQAFLDKWKQDRPGSDLTVIHNLCTVLTALKQVLNQKSQIWSRVAQISNLSQ